MSLGIFGQNMLHPFNDFALLCPTVRCDDADFNRTGSNSLAVNCTHSTIPPTFSLKQTRQYIPDLALPPWRTPAPGEPGWDPILNYCEVKQDEEEALEVYCTVVVLEISAVLL